MNLISKKYLLFALWTLHWKIVLLFALWTLHQKKSSFHCEPYIEKYLRFLHCEPYIEKGFALTRRNFHRKKVALWNLHWKKVLFWQWEPYIEKKFSSFYCESYSEKKDLLFALWTLHRKRFCSFIEKFSSKKVLLLHREPYIEKLKLVFYNSMKNFTLFFCCIFMQIEKLLDFFLVCFCLVYLFIYWHINICGWCNAKSIIVKA